MRSLVLVLGCLRGAWAATRPNFLFFQPDELRAESAFHEVATPHMDRLVATGGVRFTGCHASHTVCSQSRAAFMTGWPTHVAGHRSLWSLLRSHEPNLFHYLKDAGYDIAWHGKNDNLDADSLRADVAEHGAGAGTDHGGRKYDDPADARYYSFVAEPAPNVTQDERGRRVPSARLLAWSRPR